MLMNSRISSRSLVVPAALLLFAAGGCRFVPPPPDGYYGPTRSLSEVVSAINANNRKINSVWARHDFEAVIYDDKGRSHSLSGNGTLLYRKPEEMFLKAGGVIDFFEAGVNPGQYWFTVYPKEVSTQWWGDRKNFSEAAARQIPIRPDLLMEVLGVQEIREDFLKPPVPVLRFNNDADAYMIVWSAPTPDRWVVLKEVWYDRKTLLPRAILLFDSRGRIVTRAYLADYREIQDTTAKMATSFDLFFPETKSQLSVRIKELRETLKKGKVTFPNDASFALPEEPGVEKRIEIR